MQTVGQVLKEMREERMFTLEEVEKATKIRKELLVALEADDYTKLPPSTFVQGFIKNYARFLGIDSGKLLAIFRREFSSKKNPDYIMDAFSHPLRRQRWQLTPTRVLGLVVAIAVLSFFAYLWVQYRQYTGAPTLELSAPQDQITTDNPELKVIGKTDPETKVTINSQQITVGDNGEFNAEIKLSSEVNRIDVVAASKFGQTSEMIRTVYLKR